jgi:hypothetical protein
MAGTVTDAQFRKLVTELKKHPGNSERHYSEATGIPIGNIGSVLYKAELEADPSLKIAKTAAAVVKARKQGLRWPRIAAYSGQSVAKVKELYEEGSGEDPSKSWTGRGRRFDGESGKKATTGQSGRRGKAAAGNKGTSGRRGKATSSAPAAGRGRGRRGTRAGADPK